MLSFFKKDIVLWKMILTIAIPMALQNLLFSLTQMMDTIMLGELGDIPLTASSLANQPFFIFSLFIFGLSGGCSVLASQYWGKHEMEPIKIIVATALRLSTVVACCFAVVIYTFPEQIMNIYTNDPLVIEQGVAYLKIMAPAYILYGISCTTFSLYRSIEVVKLAVLAGTATLLMNVSLNYILIFGNFGAPRLELRGAAYATLISRTVELTVVIIYILFVEKKLNFKLPDILKKDKALSKDLVKYASPVIANEILWSLGISMQAALFGNISTLAVSANTIISVVQNLSMLFIIGVAGASCIIIGKTIGEGDLELAKSRSNTLRIFALMLGVCGGIAILVFRDFMVDFYNVEEATKILAKEMLVMTSIIIFFVSTSAISIVGLLRGGGDTKFALKAEIISLWCVAIPLGYLAGLYFEMPVVVVYALFKSDELVKCVMCWFRLSGDKWINSVTREV